MSDEKRLTLPQAICRLEGGEEQVNIAQVSEVLRCLADLMVGDPHNQVDWWQHWILPAMQRRADDEGRMPWRPARSLKSPAAPNEPDPED